MRHIKITDHNKCSCTDGSETRKWCVRSSMRHNIFYLDFEFYILSWNHCVSQNGRDFQESVLNEILQSSGREEVCRMRITDAHISRKKLEERLSQFIYQIHDSYFDGSGRICWLFSKIPYIDAYINREALLFDRDKTIKYLDSVGLSHFCDKVDFLLSENTQYVTDESVKVETMAVAKLIETINKRTNGNSKKSKLQRASKACV